MNKTLVEGDEMQSPRAVKCLTDISVPVKLG